MFPIRPIRIFSRLFRKPKLACAYPGTVPSPEVKDEASMELLNSYNQDIKAGGVVPVFRRALLFPSRIALQDEVGIYTYAGLYQAASLLSTEIAAQLAGETETTISYMCSNDASHVIVQWAIWMSGNIAVPLTPLHPPEMLKYFISDSNSQLIVCTSDFEKILRPITLSLKKPLLITSRDKEITAQLYQPNNTFLKGKVDNLKDDSQPNSWYKEADAMIIYTSGTTSKPKGVVWSHEMVSHQISSLHAAWRYAASDVVLHTLPLHHIHGQLNSLNASLAAGARIRMLPSFVAHTVWARLLGMGEKDDAKVTVFHGVPAMYMKLAAAFDQMFNTEKTSQYVRSTLETRMRLMCCGSAPLPASLAEKWYKISGHRLLERYGMSEAGMALSNPYSPSDARTVGCVGMPLPGMSARIASVEEGKLSPLVTVDTPMCDLEISLPKLGLSSSKEHDTQGGWNKAKVTLHTKTPDDTYQGELLLKGKGVFSRYYNRAPKIDNSEFTDDDWFRTGDIATYSNEKFKILGRASMDIIKTSGYKVSALQVESAVLEHPDVTDAAVIGVDDEEHGEIIAAVVVVKPNTKLTLRELKNEAGKLLAPYQLPKAMLIVEELPRNVMGKLDKKEIKRLFADKLTLNKST